MKRMIDPAESRLREARQRVPASPRGLAETPPVAWRSVLRGVTGAIGRLHRYRDLRTQMLRDALRRRDCGRPAGPCDE